jgi:hypothetical protein
MVAGGRDEDLGLVLEAAEGLGMEDAVAVALELSAVVRRFLGSLAHRFAGPSGPRSEAVLTRKQTFSHVIAGVHVRRIGGGS